MRAPPRIVESDDRRADLHRQVHDLADLLRVRFRKRAAENRKILRKDKNLAAVDQAVAGDDAVAGKLLLLHPEIGRTMHDKFVELFKAAFVQKKFDAFARGHFPARRCFSRRACPPPSSAFRERSRKSSILFFFFGSVFISLNNTGFCEIFHHWIEGQTGSDSNPGCFE